MNLGHGILSTEVAQALASRGVPFVFATGYGSHGVIDVFKSTPVIKKPFLVEELRQALALILVLNASPGSPKRRTPGRGNPDPRAAFPSVMSAARL